MEREEGIELVPQRTRSVTSREFVAGDGGTRESVVTDAGAMGGARFGRGDFGVSLASRPPPAASSPPTFSLNSNPDPPGATTARSSNQPPMISQSTGAEKYIILVLKIPRGAYTCNQEWFYLL